MNEDTIHEFHLAEIFVIVATVEIVHNDVNTLNKIFKTLWKNNLLNAHVLIQDQPQFWTLYTFMPYQKDCSNLSDVKIESFTPFNYTENMTVTKDQLFPEKLNDFNQCPLTIAIAYLNPFIIAPENADANHTYDGIEFEIVEQIAKSLNFHPVFVSSTDGTAHGVILANKTITGNLKLVPIFQNNSYSLFLRLI